ncbi:DUF4192 domain-containing protein [Nocardioides sp. Bht2]|uniref:DUF4192 domain-containing protein n=1 Tax=Nocardioides sp. Bht2 TaxID=3392297 RepID=UPI0039B6954C
MERSPSFAWGDNQVVLRTPHRRPPPAAATHTETFFLSRSNNHDPRPPPRNPSATRRPSRRELRLGAPYGRLFPHRTPLVDRTPGLPSSGPSRVVIFLARERQKQGRQRRANHLTPRRKQVTMTTIALHNPSETVALVSRMLGFHPTESLVILTLGSGGPCARIDLPHEGRDVLEAVMELWKAFRQYPGEVLVIAYTEDADAADVVVQALMVALGTTSPVRVALRVTGDEWYDMTGWANGRIESTDPSVFPAKYANVEPLPTRKHLDATLKPVGRAARVKEIQTDGLARVLAVAEVIAMIDRYLSDETLPSDNETADLLLTLTSKRQAMNAAQSKISQSTADEMTKFWTYVLQSAYVSDEAAGLLALASWVAGNGALSWCALDRVKNYTRLADYVKAVLEEPRNPSAWHPATVI